MGRLPWDRRWRRWLVSIGVGIAVAAQPTSAATVESNSEAVVFALTLLGTPYRYGGNRPSTGFDCSGFVRFVFGEAFNVDLPRRSQDMRHVGKRLTIEAVEPGDLLFFNTLGQPWSHVAIAIGDGQFVHAPARGGRVRVERLTDPYWTKRFNGARRIWDAARAEVRPAIPDAPVFQPSIVDDPRVTP